MSTDTVADEIHPKIAETAALLAKPPLRWEIDDEITRNRLDPKGVRARMMPDELAKDLAKNLVETWPFEPAGFDAIQRMLSPLKEISAILDPDKLNEFVRVRDACVIDDRRMPVSDFKKALCQRLFPPSNHCEQ